MNLAHAYYGVGRITDANAAPETVERCELSLPASDPLTVAARTSLANIRRRQPVRTRTMIMGRRDDEPL